MKKILTTIFTLAALSLTILPTAASAAIPWNFSTDKIIPCGQSDTSGAIANPCELCDLFDLIQNIFEVLITMSATITFLMIIVGGIMYIVGPAVGTEWIQRAKNTITGAVIGFILTVTAWMAINTLALALGYGNGWSQIQCNGLIPEFSIPEGTVTVEVCDNGFYLDESTWPEVAEATGMPNPPTEHPDLLFEDPATGERTGLIPCMEKEMRDRNLTSSDWGTAFTYEQTNEFCNYNRGQDIPQCGLSCAHSKNSCHYGGAAGTGGAMAVDWTMTPGDDDPDDAKPIIEAAYACDAKFAQFEGNHVHVSIKACDRN